MQVILNHLVTIGIQPVPMLLAAVVVYLSSASREVKLVWIAAALGLILVEDVLLTGLWLLIPQPEWWGQWNWTGKALALGGSLYIASLKPMGLDATGVRFYQEPGSGIAWAAAAIALVALAVIVLLMGEGTYQGTDTLIYQTLLAAPEEELFYRGTLFLVLDRAFLERRELYGAKVGPAVLLTALYYASVHGIVRDGYGFEFRPPLIAAYLAAGLFLGWLRARTGSLLAPTLTHMAGNGLLMLAIL